MADTTTITCTEVRENNGVVSANSMQSHYTRTFTFPVLASATGYGDTDILNLVTIPKDTLIKDIFIKASVTQANSTTFTFSLASQTIGVATVPVTTGFTGIQMAVADQATDAITTADTTLVCTLGVGTCTAATITVTLMCCALGTTAAPYTTYSI
jgi:hypothetical protein